MPVGNPDERADALLHIVQARDLGEWQPPDCHRVNGRLCAPWEVQLVFDARMDERAREVAIVRGLVGVR